MIIPRPKSLSGSFLYALTLGALLAAGHILWVLGAQNIESLSSDKGYDKLLSRHWSDVAMWMASNVFWLSMLASALIGGAMSNWLFVALLDRERRPLVQAVSADLSGLADDAERVASGINRIVSELASKPPTHPDFDMSSAKDGPERWQRENFNRRESAIRQYRSEFMVPAWKIIETAGKYIDIDQNVIWRVKRVYSDDDLDEMVRLLASISAKLCLIKPRS